MGNKDIKNRGDLEMFRKLLKERAMEFKYRRHNPDIDCDCEDCRVANKVLEIIHE